MRHKGFTIVELLLVMALLALVGVFTIPLGVSFMETQRVEDAASELTFALRSAASQAHAGKDDSSYGVVIADGAYVLFKGDSYAARTSPADESYPFSQAIAVTGLTEVVFEAGTGLPNEVGTTTLTLGNHEARVTITTEGIVSR